jgi:SHS2 domain-containing protein
MNSGWEHFAHDADMGIRGYGMSKSRAFEQAATAMTALICDPDRVRPESAVSISCEAPDDELLLTEWLNQLVYEMAVRKMLFSRFEVHIDRTHLEGVAWGESIDPKRHHPAVEVKGATYTGLRVACERGTWLAQTVVDV